MREVRLKSKSFESRKKKDPMSLLCSSCSGGRGWCEDDGGRGGSAATVLGGMHVGGKHVS